MQKMTTTMDGMEFNAIFVQLFVIVLIPITNVR